MTALLRYCWYYLRGYRKRLDVEIAGDGDSVATVHGPVWVKENRRGFHALYERIT